MNEYRNETENEGLQLISHHPGVVFVCTKPGLDFIARKFPRLRSRCMCVDEIERDYTVLKRWGFPCLLLAVSPEEVESLESTIAAIPDFSAISAKSLLLGDAADAIEQLAFAALLEIQFQRKNLLTSLWDVNKSLAQMRREYEKVIENFSLATQSFGSVSTPNVYLSHSIEPEPSRISSAGNGFGLVQRVSLLTRGLMSIELHIPQPIGDVHGELKVSYFEGYTAVPQFSWTRDTRKLNLGWNRFPLERSSASDEPVFRIETEWSGTGGDAPLLSLGPASPFETVNVKVAPGMTLHAPLAMRVLSGLPGVAPPRFAAGVVATHWRPAKTEVRTLVWQDVKQIKLKGESPEEPGFNLVEAREKYKDVLLHTQDSQATIAVIGNLLFNDIRGLNCLVHLSHKDASPTEFAAIVSQPELRDDEPAFVNWLRVEPLGWGQVVFMLDRPITGTCDIYLATRPVLGASSNLGWATFKRIDIVVGSEGN